MTLFAPDVVWRGDGGGRARAAVGQLRGAEEVARALLAVVHAPPRALRSVRVNGAPGLVVHDAEGVLGVVSFTVDAGRIVAVDVVRNPDKLKGVRSPGPDPEFPPDGPTGQ